ncbi:MAG TPA: class I SAM-dependent methyltransferase, partial [Pseudonocardiaceae bacterium]|nr:class I SAM-dependent methyltransferase [Pseudonocardiaceae bacterium]
AARAEERAQWTAAGIVPGARVADIGCGPGTVLRLLAEEVGNGGRADGVDLDAGAVTAAAEQVADLTQASVRVGEAAATGLDPGSYDVVMCRHVLAHNGGHEAAITAHLIELARPGGAVISSTSTAPRCGRIPKTPTLPISTPGTQKCTALAATTSPLARRSGPCSKTRVAGRVFPQRGAGAPASTAAAPAVLGRSGCAGGRPARRPG